MKYRGVIGEAEMSGGSSGAEGDDNNYGSEYVNQGGGLGGDAYAEDKMTRWRGIYQIMYQH